MLLQCIYRSRKSKVLMRNARSMRDRFTLQGWAHAEANLNLAKSVVFLMGANLEHRSSSSRRNGYGFLQINAESPTFNSKLFTHFEYKNYSVIPILGYTQYCRTRLKI